MIFACYVVLISEREREREREKERESRNKIEGGNQDEPYEIMWNSLKSSRFVLSCSLSPYHVRIILCFNNHPIPIFRRSSSLFFSTTLWNITIGDLNFYLFYRHIHIFAHLMFLQTIFPFLNRIICVKILLNIDIKTVDFF